MIAAGARKSIENVERFLSALRSVSQSVMAFDADAVLGRSHLISAWERAKRAFDRGLGICGRLEMEVICYAAAQRQISAALSRIGLKDGMERVAFLGPEEEVERVIEAMDMRRDDTLLEPSAGKLERWGLSDPDMIFERMSLMELGG